MKLHDRQEGEVVVIEFAGKIIPGEEITSFHRRVHFYLDLKKKWFVVDLKKVEWISSAGLGALIGAYASVRKAGGKLVLANVTSVQSLLNLTQLVRVFETFDSLAAAVQAVQSE